jgi:DNA-binding MarR family transcriptional regulator
MKIAKYLQQSPVFAINAAYEAQIPRINRQLKEDGLNLLQGLVLTALFFEEKNDVGPSQLAEVFRTSRGNMSHILSHLESCGYLRRALHEGDARRFRIELKSEGRRKALGLIRFYDRLQNQFEKKLGESFCQKTVAGIHSIAAVLHSERS